jgi:hypothetical protein
MDRLPVDTGKFCARFDRAAARPDDRRLIATGQGTEEKGLSGLSKRNVADVTIKI